jgi:glycolate oxidase FAD binding subunit
VEEAAACVAELGRSSTPVAPRGSGSRSPVPAGLLLETAGLNRVLEHNPGDFTAVLQAGVPLDDAQALFAAHGQWLAVDPPVGGTVGGLVATADSGPSRQRYGGVRDLVIGITVVLSDGSVASAGGKVIKNVAGYDLGKLFTGSHGSLGLIASVAVRLHPLPRTTATVTASTVDALVLERAALELTRRPLEALCLDAWWWSSTGGLLVRFGGASSSQQAAALVPVLRDLGLAEVTVVADDDDLWRAQRDGQRSADGVVVKVSGLPGDLSRVTGAADVVGASMVSRAGLGLSFIRCTAADVATLRSALRPRHCTVTDGAGLIGAAWSSPDPAVAALNRRVKDRFDPAGIFPVLPMGA